MTLAFSTAEPKYTLEGNPYCPVERKRRGPLALAASLSVMLAGAAFLAFSMTATPEPAAPAEIIKIAVDQDALEALNAPKTETAAATPENQQIKDLNASVEAALAQSRAARANAAKAAEKPVLSLSRPAAEGGLMPRLKPTAAPRLAEATPTTAEAFMVKDATGALKAFAPRVKPAGPGGLLAAAPPPVRPMRLGGVYLASEYDRPASVFFESDLNPRRRFTTPPPLAYAADIKRDIGERIIRIARGENFVDALKRAGVEADDRNEAAYAFGKQYNLRRLRPGQEFSLTLAWPNETLFQHATSAAEPAARLMGLEFRADPQNRIKLSRDEKGALTAEKSEVRLMTRTMAISGAINGSLYLSAKAQGAPNQMIADLANIFAYDIDFQREIFGGDEFEAIFDVHFDSEGEIVSSGNILFARMKWRGRTKEKAYYRMAATEDGVRADYFDAAGQSAKRLLMKTPIDGARLSSRFGTRRHPISGYRRQHKGVDFAAPRGTPIYAAGDGVVERANRYGSFGNYIRIRHSNSYKTVYAHLKGFRRGIRAGKRVKQGDVIGYVGSTGASTGPHLHYEVHHKGKAVNPQKLKMATGVKLRGVALERFKDRRDLIDAMRIPADEGSGLFAKDERQDNSL